MFILIQCLFILEAHNAFKNKYKSFRILILVLSIVCFILYCGIPFLYKDMHSCHVEDYCLLLAMCDLLYHLIIVVQSLSPDYLLQEPQSIRVPDEDYRVEEACSTPWLLIWFQCCCEALHCLDENHISDLTGWSFVLRLDNVSTYESELIVVPLGINFISGYHFSCGEHCLLGKFGWCYTTELHLFIRPSTSHILCVPTISRYTK